MKIIFQTRGIRIYLSRLGWTGDESTAKVEVVYPTFELKRNGISEDWLHIIDGSVTGYESISIKDLLKHEDWTGGWSACAGTKGRWDTLRICAEDMEQLQEYFTDNQAIHYAKAPQG